MATFLDPRVRDRVVDFTVVLGVLAFSVLQLLLGGGFGDFAEVSAEPDGPAFALVLLSALALLWRPSPTACTRRRRRRSPSTRSRSVRTGGGHGRCSPPRPQAGWRWCSS